jgi:phenylalanyl-tRNA synthetase alpha chain
MSTSDLLQQIESLRQRCIHELEEKHDPEAVRVTYLGRKGLLTQILRSLATLSDTEKRGVGGRANLVKDELTALIDASAKSQSDSTRTVDRTVPALVVDSGTLHPISVTIDEMTTIFRDLSFEIVEGREIVSDLENFENLNMTTDHPARDSQDTLYLSDSMLLRTQTTAIQVLEMRQRIKDKRLPIRIVMPGKVYRRESDPTHSPMFFQMDAVLVDQQTTLSDLKGTLQYFVERLYGPDMKTRFRPHFFPYTEPSAELDILWKHPVTGQERWLEVGGCGMIHPDVLKRSGINPRIYQGWAFGLGVERQFMVRHQVHDIRLLYGNSGKFLNQFNQFV